MAQATTSSKVLPSPVMIPVNPMKEHLVVSSWRDMGPPPMPLPPAVTAVVTAVVTSPPLLPAAMPSSVTSPQPSPLMNDSTQQTPQSSGKQPRRRKKSKGPLEADSPMVESVGAGGEQQPHSNTAPSWYGIKVSVQSVEVSVIEKSILDTCVTLGITTKDIFALPAAYSLRIKRSDQQGQGAGAGGPRNSSTPTTPVGSDLTSPESVPALDGGDLGVNDSFGLPPSATTLEEQTHPLVVALFEKECDATRISDALRSQGLTVDMVKRRQDEVRSPTLVLKGVPFAVRADKLMDELQSFPWVPSYIRFHFSDRGMFKGIAYVKYQNRDDAEKAKMVLERLRLGNKPVRVEYRKGTTSSSCISPGLSPFPTKQLPGTPSTGPLLPPSAGTPKPQLLSQPSGSPVSGAAGEDKDGVSREVTNAFESQIASLLSQKDAQGMTYPRSSMSKEEEKMLRSLAEKYKLNVEEGNEVLRVLKDPIPQTSKSSGVSPALNPQRTPPVHPSPGISGIAFRGVDHWKGVNAAHAQKLLPVLMSLAPTDPGVTPFAIGRGKPIRPI